MTPPFVRAAMDEDEQFKFALGRLVFEWANVEGALYGVIRHYGGLSDGVARALLSGTRARDLMKFTESITHNIGIDAARKENLAMVFAQIGAINTMRDKLVHYVDGSKHIFEESDPSRRYISNAHRVNRLGKEEQFLFGSADINAMCEDVVLCCWHLVAHTDRTNEPFKPLHNIPLKPRALLYKSPQPIAKASRSERPAQKSPRQPKPSRLSQRKEK